jgi:RNA polymerase sigma factor (TIGR02999 family)
MKNSEQSDESRLHPGELTQLLESLRDGDRGALDRAFVIVYRELRRLAQGQLRKEHPGHTLAATALVHEAYLKLVGNPAVQWGGRSHFFSIASRAMRQVLVDHARRRHAHKRGGEQHRTTLDDRHVADQMDPEELLALDSAMDRLAAINDRLRQIVEYRFFCGLDDAEIAQLVGVSPRTVERDWAKARAWLYQEIYPSAPKR